MFNEAALSVVVYPEPGPAARDLDLDADARRVVARHSPCKKHGGIGWITYAPAQFEVLWKGVDGPDLLAVAYAVLFHTGPDARQFIDRPDDFFYGWIGVEDERCGRRLVLDVVPRPHLIAARDALCN